MKVKTLIEILKQEDPERDVVLASDPDPEGGRYSPLSGFWQGIYVPEQTYSSSERNGEIYLERDSEGKPPEGYGDEACYDGENGKLALVLAPLN